MTPVIPPLGGFAEFFAEHTNPDGGLGRLVNEALEGSGLPEPDKGEIKATLTKILSKKPKKTHGLLIVFEGVDGAGKTSQIDKLVEWLEDQNYDVLVSRWNGHDIVKPATKEFKKRRMLSPMLYCLLHAADMVARYEWEIGPALDENKVVVCDRYWYTSLVRDEARGVDVDILKKVYEGLRTPDILFHCVVPIATAFGRLMKEKGLSYYGTGMDLNLADSKEENYIKYENILDRSYKKILPSVPTYCKLDTSKSIDQVASKVKAVMADRFSIGKYRQ